MVASRAGSIAWSDASTGRRAAPAALLPALRGAGVRL